MAEAGPSRALGTSVHCPYHPEGQLIEDHSAGDMICPECGLVVGDRYIIYRIVDINFRNNTRLQDCNIYI